MLYLSSTSNHNKRLHAEDLDTVVLYLSSTSNHNYNGTQARYFELCYIFLLHQTTTAFVSLLNVTVLCYIFLLHQTTTCRRASEETTRCVISFFYIKPQLNESDLKGQERCVISFFYIKPQHLHRTTSATSVVLYLSSTSNHNLLLKFSIGLDVVLYLSSTSNHNKLVSIVPNSRLCYIFLLHQTTTYKFFRCNQRTLCYIFLLHQTTTITKDLFLMP